MGVYIYCFVRKKGNKNHKNWKHFFVGSSSTLSLLERNNMTMENWDKGVPFPSLEDASDGWDDIVSSWKIAFNAIRGMEKFDDHEFGELFNQKNLVIPRVLVYYYKIIGVIEYIHENIFKQCDEIEVCLQSEYSAIGREYFEFKI